VRGAQQKGHTGADGANRCEGQDHGVETVQEREDDWAVVRSSSIRVREGDRRWRAERRQPAGRAAVARAGGGRRLGSLTGWAHLSVRGRRRADWAGKGGRRWATAGLEKEGGGWAETIARSKIQKSKKENQF
jgi:hypothetical protein